MKFGYYEEIFLIWRQKYINKILSQQNIITEMQENLVLRQVTNLPLESRTFAKKQSQQITSPQSSEQPKPTFDQLIRLSSQQLDFGYCLPGSIHEKNFTIHLQQQLAESSQLAIFIVCEDEALYDDSSCLVFGIKRIGQQEYYDDYRMKIKSKRAYEFRIGVKTPMFYEYDVKCSMYISFLDYAPKAVVLKQKIQVPEIVCTKQLYFEEERVIKLSIIQGRGKRQCRVPFKMNHQMTISVNAQLIGLTEQKNPIVEIKPKSMTLAGKGQFSLVFTMNTNEEIRQSLSSSIPHIVRRVLTFKIKQTKFTYHYPIEITYYPESKKGNSEISQQF